MTDKLIMDSMLQELSDDDDVASQCSNGSFDDKPSTKNEIKNGADCDVNVPEETVGLEPECPSDLNVNAKDLEPCPICTRTFRPNTLSKHIGICERMQKKKRKPFDSFRQRREGTELDVYLPKHFGVSMPKCNRTELIPAGKNSTSNHSHQRSVSPEQEEETHMQSNDKINNNLALEEKVSSTISSPGLSFGKPTTAAPMVQRASRRNLAPVSEQCPYCERTFGVKAYDRHVEWCKDKALIAAYHKPRPTANPAKERLEARTKYKAPSLRSKRDQTRDKYSGMSRGGSTNSLIECGQPGSFIKANSAERERKSSISTTVSMTSSITSDGELNVFMTEEENQFNSTYDMPELKKNNLNSTDIVEDQALIPSVEPASMMNDSVETINLYSELNTVIDEERNQSNLFVDMPEAGSHDFNCSESEYHVLNNSDNLFPPVNVCEENTTDRNCQIEESLRTTMHHLSLDDFPNEKDPVTVVSLKRPPQKYLTIIKNDKNMETVTKQSLSAARSTLHSRSRKRILKSCKRSEIPKLIKGYNKNNNLLGNEDIVIRQLIIQESIKNQPSAKVEKSIFKPNILKINPTVDVIASKLFHNENLNKSDLEYTAKQVTRPNRKNTVPSKLKTKPRCKISAKTSSQLSSNTYHIDQPSPLLNNKKSNKSDLITDKKQRSVVITSHNIKRELNQTIGKYRMYTGVTESLERIQVTDGNDMKLSLETPPYYLCMENDGIKSMPEITDNQSIENLRLIENSDTEINQVAPRKYSNDSLEVDLKNKLSDESNVLEYSEEMVHFLHITNKNNQIDESGLSDKYDPFISAKRQLEELFSPTNLSNPLKTSTPKVATTQTKLKTPVRAIPTPTTPQPIIKNNINRQMSTSMYTKSSNSTNALNTVSPNNNNNPTASLNSYRSLFHRTSSLRMPKKTSRPSLYIIPKLQSTIQRGLSDDGPISTNFMKPEEYDELPVKCHAIVTPELKSPTKDQHSPLRSIPSPLVVQRNSSARKNLHLDLKSTNSPNLLSSSAYPMTKTDSLAVFLKYENDFKDNITVPTLLSEKELKDKSNSSISKRSSLQTTFLEMLDSKIDDGDIEHDISSRPLTPCSAPPISHSYTFNQHLPQASTTTVQHNPNTFKLVPIERNGSTKQRSVVISSQTLLHPDENDNVTNKNHHPTEYINKTLEIISPLDSNDGILNFNVPSKTVTPTTTSTLFPAIDTSLVDNNFDKPNVMIVNQRNLEGGEKRNLNRQLKLNKENFLYDLKTPQTPIKLLNKETLSTVDRSIIEPATAHNSADDKREAVHIDNIESLFNDFDFDEFVSSFEDDEQYPIFKDYKDFLSKRSKSSTRSKSNSSNCSESSSTESSVGKNEEDHDYPGDRQYNMSGTIVPNETNNLPKTDLTNQMNCINNNRSHYDKSQNSSQLITGIVSFPRISSASVVLGSEKPTQQQLIRRPSTYNTKEREVNTMSEPDSQQPTANNERMFDAVSGHSGLLYDDSMKKRSTQAQSKSEQRYQSFVSDAEQELIKSVNELDQMCDSSTLSSYKYPIDSDELSSIESYPMRRNIITKMNGSDSAYGSLSRQSPPESYRQVRTKTVQRNRTQLQQLPDTGHQIPTPETKIYSQLAHRQPLPPPRSNQQMNLKNDSVTKSQQFDGTNSSSESDVSLPPVNVNSNNTNKFEQMTTNQNSSNLSSSALLKMSKFCHECGSKFMISQAKFCMECGVRRILID